MRGFECWLCNVISDVSSLVVTSDAVMRWLLCFMPPTTTTPPIPRRLSVACPFDHQKCAAEPVVPLTVELTSCAGLDHNTGTQGRSCASSFSVSAAPWSSAGHTLLHFTVIYQKLLRHRHRNEGLTPSCIWCCVFDQYLSPTFISFLVFPLVEHFAAGKEHSRPSHFHWKQLDAVEWEPIHRPKARTWNSIVHLVKLKHPAKQNEHSVDLS